MKTFSYEIFILFSIGSQLSYYSLKTEQNKVKVIASLKRPNLTRKIGDDDVEKDIPLFIK